VLVQPLRNGVSPSKAGTVTADVLTLSAITGSAFDASAVKNSTFTSALVDRKTVSIADFLICRGNGNRSLVGRAKYPNASLPKVAFPDTMIAARCDGERISRAFLDHIWDHDLVRHQMDALARTTNGTFKINQSMIESIVLPLPPIELQRTFDTCADRVSAQRELSGRGVDQLATLFTSLQHRAFRGEL